MPLVPLDKAQLHLRVDDGEQAFEVADKLAMAESIVIDYLKYDPSGWDEATTPKVVQAAILLVLGGLWEQRGGEVDDSIPVRDVVLTTTVKSLLHRHRDPALA